MQLNSPRSSAYTHVIAGSPSGARMTYSCWNSVGAVENVPSIYQMSAVARCRSCVCDANTNTRSVATSPLSNIRNGCGVSPHVCDQEPVRLMSAKVAGSAGSIPRFWLHLKRTNRPGQFPDDLPPYRSSRGKILKCYEITSFPHKNDCFYLHHTGLPGIAQMQA